MRTDCCMCPPDPIVGALAPVAAVRASWVRDRRSRARREVCAGRGDNLRRGGGRFGHWNSTRPRPRASARWRRRRCTCRPDRSSPRSRPQTVSARRVDNLRCRGGRSGDRNIRARRPPASARSRPRRCTCRPDRSSARSRPRGYKCPQGRQSAAAEALRYWNVRAPQGRAGAGAAARPGRTCRSAARVTVRARRSTALRRGAPAESAGRDGARWRGAAVRPGRIDRRRARARQTVSAGKVDNLRRSGGRSGDGNIRARGRQRGRARARAAVSAGRIDRRRGPSRQAISARRVYKVCCGASLIVVAGRAPLGLSDMIIDPVSRLDRIEAASTLA